MRTRFVLIAVLGVAISFIAGPASVAAQINIAAIAQFKYNQQHALAASLSKTRTSSSGKHSARKSNKSVPARPTVIHAHNPTFKSIYGDMHTRNVR